VALITTAGATFYVLGLVGLAMPIYRTFTHDLSTAWYVVSMVPRTVVAGQGVRIWLQWPIFVIALAFIGGFLWGLIIGGSSRTDLVLLLVGFVIVAYQARKLKMGCLSALLYLIGVEVGVVLINLGAGNYIGYLVQSGTSTLVGTIEIFFGSLLVGLLPAITAQPPLPKVVLAKQDGPTIEEVPDSLEGRLVAHSDGFWHLFVEEQHELLSIPDDKVLGARFPAKEAQPSRTLEGRPATGDAQDSPRRHSWWSRFFGT
jgi:hypothetical protein